MIKSFADRETRMVFRRQYSKKLPAEIQKRARDKLLMLDNAQELRDLRHPPGNRLEKLSGDRAGQWSIRINQQWRVCFEWHRGDVHAVEIVDYH